MLEKSENIFINPENPFENCKLERESIADNLTKIIEGIKGSFVLGVDSPWGTGKSTFIEMWQKKLELERSEDIFTIYFNAWENDFHGEILLALVGELEKYLEKYLVKTSKSVTKKDLKTTASSIGSNVIKKLTFDTLDLKELYKELDGTKERQLFNKYKEYNDLKESIKKNLREIKTKLGVKKVVFFIDELDRCRPNYAVETLEKLKHLFEVKDYIFVLSLDKEQLSHSVSTIYGEGMDSVGYLRRFIDMDYLLPMPDKDKYIDYLLEKHNLNVNKRNNFYFERMIRGFAKEDRVSLRDLEKLFYQVKLILPLTSLNNKELNDRVIFSLGISYAFLLCFKNFQPEELKNENITYKNLITREYSTSQSRIISNLALKWIKNNVNDTPYDKATSGVIKKALELNLKRSIDQSGSLNVEIERRTTTFNIGLELFNSNGEFKIIKDIEFINNFSSK